MKSAPAKSGPHYISKGDSKAASAILLEAFEKLGFPIPRKAGKLLVLIGLLKVFIQQRMTGARLRSLLTFLR